MRTPMPLLAAAAAFGAVAVARAEDWPRFQIGAAIGNPHWSADLSDGISVPGYPVIGQGPAEPASGWKLVAGFRPLRIVGVEIQYVDFGEGDFADYSGRYGGGQIGYQYVYESHTRASAHATVVAALLFIPMAETKLDIGAYGKVGIGKLNDSISKRTATNACYPLKPCYSTVNTDVHQSETAPYVGVGVSVRPGKYFALRLEYEAIYSDFGDPTTMLSLGFAWGFAKR
jgi:outer membrane protein with beta-barrel domain